MITIIGIADLRRNFQNKLVCVVRGKYKFYTYLFCHYAISFLIGTIPSLTKDNRSSVDNAPKPNEVKVLPSL